MPSHARTLLPVALALCLVLAGCVSTAPGVGPDTTTDSATRTSTPAPLDPALSSCSVPEVVSPTPTTEPGTRSGTGDVSAGLEIASNYDGDLTVVLRRLPQNVTTFARRYSPEEATIDLGPEMADKSGYWTIIVADCEVVWSRPVRDYEALSVRVDRDGNVSIEQLVEA
jgi:hypothetical protein